MKKGGVVLKVYRCARGSTFLESFHSHLKNFIPGTTANDQNFQAYLLEGIVCWNEDRVSASVQGQKVGGLRTYNTKLHFAANELSNKVYGRPLHANVQHPGVFTVELLGVQYLYDQTGKPFVFVDLENEVAEDHFEEDQDEDLEDVTDLTVASAALGLDHANFLPTQPAGTEQPAETILPRSHPRR